MTTPGMPHYVVTVEIERVFPGDRRTVENVARVVMSETKLDDAINKAERILNVLSPTQVAMPREVKQ